MGLDFWAVKIKKGKTKENFTFDDCWSLVEDEEIHDTIDKDISDFILNQNDKVWYNFCIETVGCFVGGDPIHINSQEDINILADKLNEFIKENPNYEYNHTKYNNGYDEIYSNEDIRKFIKYINFARDNGFVLWCSW